MFACIVFGVFIVFPKFALSNNNDQSILADTTEINEYLNSESRYSNKLSNDCAKGKFSSLGCFYRSLLEKIHIITPAEEQSETTNNRLQENILIDIQSIGDEELALDGGNDYGYGSWFGGTTTGSSYYGSWASNNLYDDNYNYYDDTSQYGYWYYGGSNGLVSDGVVRDKAKYEHTEEIPKAQDGQRTTNRKSNSKKKHHPKKKLPAKVAASQTQIYNRFEGKNNASESSATLQQDNELNLETGKKESNLRGPKQPDSRLLKTVQFDLMLQRSNEENANDSDTDSCCIPPHECNQSGIACPLVGGGENPQNYDPVCGCDGKTYSNACYAEVFGCVRRWTVGECSPSST